jgi:hypothetical protein
VRPILQRLAAEPAAVGTTLASVLPALTALGIISLDGETVGILVVAVNALVGFGIRMVVAPLIASAGAAAPTPAAAAAPAAADA